MGNEEPLIPMLFEDVCNNRWAARYERAVLQPACAPDFFLANDPADVAINAGPRLHGPYLKFREIGPRLDQIGLDRCPAGERRRIAT